MENIVEIAFSAFTLLTILVIYDFSKSVSKQ
jgi:hypothetical protein